jgi:hypothetical protein
MKDVRPLLLSWRIGRCARQICRYRFPLWLSAARQYAVGPKMQVQVQVQVLFMRPDPAVCRRGVTGGAAVSEEGAMGRMRAIGAGTIVAARRKC